MLTIAVVIVQWFMTQLLLLAKQGILSVFCASTMSREVCVTV